MFPPPDHESGVLRVHYMPGKACGLVGSEVPPRRFDLAWDWDRYWIWSYV